MVDLQLNPCQIVLSVDSLVQIMQADLCSLLHLLLSAFSLINQLRLLFFGSLSLAFDQIVDVQYFRPVAVSDAGVE